MLISKQGHVVRPGEGRLVDLGVTRMRVLAAGQDVTQGAFTLAEFSGSRGPGRCRTCTEAWRSRFSCSTVSSLSRSAIRR
jgi:hypothetical protein